MLYYLLFPLREQFGAFNVFRYASFRMIGAVLTALLLSLLLGPRFIVWLKSWQYGVSNVREDTPQTHLKKVGTPSFGGLLILFSLLVSVLLWGRLDNVLLWSVMIVTLAFGAIGFADDYFKYRLKNSKGLSARKKLLFQLVILSLVTWLLRGELDTKLSLPFIAVEKFNPDIGFFYIPFAFIVIMGTSNAVNLTDGLDGLAIGPTIVSAATFLVLSYAAGSVLSNFDIAHYLRIPYLRGAHELAIFCAALAGAGMGFLWFNAQPAEMFMGDVGALAIGGGLGAMAVLTKNELVSAVIHGLFLAEALSVMLQVLSFKMWGKRIFRMAPLHHHFELKGWAEQKIVIRFWLVSVVLAMCALATLKLR